MKRSKRSSEISDAAYKADPETKGLTMKDKLRLCQALTYFLVKFEPGTLDLAKFSEALGLNAEALERFGTECTLEIGRNSFFQPDINEMLRVTLKDLLGKERILSDLKRKYRLDYSLERVPVLYADGKIQNQRLSLDDDILAFMYLSGTHDDLDYFIFPEE